MAELQGSLQNTIISRLTCKDLRKETWSLMIDILIISHGTIAVTYGNKKVLVHGELTIDPPVFYAEKNSIKQWEKPYDKEQISEEIINEIVQYLSENGISSAGTKILFE